WEHDQAQDHDEDENRHLERLPCKHGSRVGRNAPWISSSPLTGSQRRRGSLLAPDAQGRGSRGGWPLEVEAGIVGQRLGELSACLKALGRILRQRTPQDLVEGRRELLVENPGRAWLLVENTIDDGGDGVPAEGALPGRQLIEHHAQR